MAAINATLANGATWTASTQDGSAYALDLDGVNDYAVASHDAKLNLTNSFAILMRFKAKSVGLLSDYALSKLNSAGTDNNWSLLWGYVTSSIEFYAGGYSGSNPRTSSTIGIPDTNWHAVAYKYNGTEWAKFIDGTKTVISASISFSLATGGTNSLYIGSFSPSANFCNACIDDLIIYKDNLPSDAEINAWQTSYTFPTSVSPVARWQFNEGSGTTAADSGVEPSSPLTIAAFCEDDITMQTYQLNQTTSPLTFEMRSSSSGLLTTGLSPTVRLSKNGAAFATPAGTVGEMTLGWYSVAVSATDFNTLGSLNLLATAANCITTTKRMMVVGHSPTTGLPSIAPGLSGGMLVGSGTGTVVLTSGGSTYSVDAAGVNIATAASVPTLSGIASTVAASVPTNAQIASTVAANVPTNAQIAATVAANLPTNASIATTVAAVLPTNASIASTVASAITADHGSGSYTTANVSSLATTSQLASSSATILSAIPTLSGIASTIAASVPTNAQIAATVASAITADHGSGSYATADVSSLATTTQLASSSATLLAAIPSISTLATTSQLAASSAALLTQVNLAIATSAAILDDTGTSGVVVAAASKTGYGLASDGLDSISTTAPSGVATNFRQMVVQTWRRLFKKTSLTSTQLKTFADDGTTVVTTQAVTNSGGTETVGNAS